MPGLAATPVRAAGSTSDTPQDPAQAPPGLPADLWQGTQQDQQQAQSGIAGNYLVKNGDGTTWMRPYGGDNTSWMYGSNSPTAGVDARAWNNISNPLAYQYGGQYGGAESEEDRYAKMGSTVGSNAAPQIDWTGYNNALGNSNDAMGSQQDALALMQQRAMGGGPSVAAAQMQQGLGQAQQQQLQTAASARGGGANLVAAQQLAASNNAQMVGQNLLNTGVARAQEQTGALQNYGSMANELRGSNLQQAGLAASTAGQQAGLQMSQNQLNQQGQLAYEAMRQGVMNSQMGAQMAGEAQNWNVGQQQALLNWQQQQADTAFQRQLIGGGLTAAGTAGGAMIGGPAGAYAGGQLGSMAGNYANQQTSGMDTSGNGGGPSGMYQT